MTSAPPSSMAAPAEAAPPADPLGACAAAVPYAALPVIARLAAADDVAAAPDGSLWIDDAAHTLVHVAAGGVILQRFTSLPAPEGVAMLPDGTVLLAEQNLDRVVRLDPATQAMSTVVQLTPRTGQEGVDGAGYDAQTNMALVPDSPNGSLLQVPIGGGAPTRLASGVGRPVGVAVAADGSFLVAAEDATGLFRVPAGGGPAAPLSGVSQGDDVVVVNRVAYVTSLSAHQLIAVDLDSRRTRILVTGDRMPQGLGLMPDGRLVLTDSATGTAVAVRTC